MERSDSDFSPPPTGPAEVLSAMMGGLQQDPCIIACRLCHISLTLNTRALNPWLPTHESFRTEKESAKLMPMGLYVMRQRGMEDETAVIGSSERLKLIVVTLG